MKKLKAEADKNTTNMSKIEFTQILKELDKMEAEAEMTQVEAEDVEMKMEAMPLNEELSEELNEMETGASSKSALKQSGNAVQRLKSFLRGKT